MGKPSTTEANLSFRVDKDLREKFSAACLAKDITPSQSLRQHMREVVDKYERSKKKGTANV